MQKLTLSVFGGLLLTSSLYAANIAIPDSSFENLSAGVSSPSGLALGTNSGLIGAWTAAASGLAGLGSSITAGNSLGGPPADDGSYYVRLFLPAAAGLSLSLSQ